MRLLKLILFILFPVFIHAQSPKLTGKVVDSFSNTNITNALVTIYNPTDSALVSFTRIATDGSFELPKPKLAKVCILISHPKFADLLDTIAITDATNDLGLFYLTSKKRVLEQVVIRAKISPIKISGDTTIFTADSFKVKDGGTVEDLFRVLPSFTVGRNGTITAMGKTVKNILVDGEQFFGNDPGMVSKSLAAEAVDKVEVYEKKSDQATFSGIDDGQTETTVNLKLKESKKKGYFGKAEIAGGTPNNFDMQAMINAFKKKRKLAAYGMAGNVGNTQLDWDDAENFGGGEGINFNAEEGMIFMSREEDEFSNFWGGAKGIPRNWNTAVHYSNKFNGDKHNVNLSYKYNKINTIAENRSYTRTFLPDTSWDSRTNNYARGSKARNKVNGTYEVKIDSLNTIKLTFDISEQNSTALSITNSETNAKIGGINGINRRNTDDNESKRRNAGILWMHKFKKLGRTMSINANSSVNESDGVSYLYSLNDYYRSGVFFRRDTTDLKRITSSESVINKAKIAYTEPLNKKIVMEIAHSYSATNNTNNRFSFSKKLTGAYETLETDFSNNFEFSTTTHTPSLNFNYKMKKLRLGLGASVAINKFEQINITTNQVRTYNFTNFFPIANANIQLKKNTNVSIRYNGSAIQPTLNQLQPLPDNTNPFSIVVGNPLLKQSFRHGISGNINKWDMLTQKSIWGYFDFNITQNAFTVFSKIDSFGRDTRMFVNVNGNYMGNFSSQHRFKNKKLDADVYFGPTVFLMNNNDFANGIKNNNKSGKFSIQFGFSKWKEDKNEEGLWSIDMNTSPSFNFARSSINNTSNRNFWGLSSDIDLGFRLFKSTMLYNTINLEQLQKVDGFNQNNNMMLWNISLKSELIKKKFELKLMLRDALNQNRGFNRFFGGFSYMEQFNNTLRRYWLLTATYKFYSQNKLKNAK